MNQQLELDLKRTMEMISADWEMQNNKTDKRTNFIYKTTSLDECLHHIQIQKVDRDYTLHRWYNYMTSVYCEEIFCDYGAVHERNKYNHDVDIYIDSISFDVKLTVYPAKLSNRPFDLTTRDGKNSMIKWYYENQSQENRKQLLNRLYVVCDADTSQDRMNLKSDFNLMRQKIQSFMQWIKIQGINEVAIKDNGIIYNLKSDIIYLKI